MGEVSPRSGYGITPTARGRKEFQYRVCSGEGQERHQKACEREEKVKNPVLDLLVRKGDVILCLGMYNPEVVFVTSAFWSIFPGFSYLLKPVHPPFP